jgi:O-6-methylguanine DNA methyltransferase
MTLHLTLDAIASPIGEMLVVTDATGALRSLDWREYEPRMRRLLRLHYGDSVRLSAGPAPQAVRKALDDYFAGDIAAIDSLPTATGGTDFQRAVWAALRQIPAGETWSYSGLAVHIGRPKAVRAVGLANGSNPVGLVVPCHRVIGANGALTGYGGGMERKRWLLEHEGASPARRAA